MAGGGMGGFAGRGETNSGAGGPGVGAHQAAGQRAVVEHGRGDPGGAAADNPGPRRRAGGGTGGRSRGTGFPAYSEVKDLFVIVTSTSSQLAPTGCPPSMSNVRGSPIRGPFEDHPPGNHLARAHPGQPTDADEGFPGRRPWTRGARRASGSTATGDPAEIAVTPRLRA